MSPVISAAAHIGIMLVAGIVAFIFGWHAGCRHERTNRDLRRIYLNTECQQLDHRLSALERRFDGLVGGNDHQYFPGVRPVDPWPRPSRTTNKEPTP